MADRPSSISNPGASAEGGASGGDDKAAQIAAFLDSGVWQIAPDREQTRRALAECLAAMPAELLRQLFGLMRVLVLAPGCQQAAAAYSFRFQASSEDVETCVVYLDQRIETYEFEAARKVIMARLASACAKLAGLDDMQAEQIARQAANDPGRPC